MLREYLQSPRGPVARAEEIDAFGAAVDELRRAADRLQARLDGDQDDPE
jgi:ubiquinone biosynthesis protein UbiJ